MTSTRTLIASALVCLVIASTFASRSSAAVISFQANDFGLNPVFSDVQTFAFTIDVSGPIVPGTTYTNPALNGVRYNVSGSLAAGTPSGFPGFNLNRPEDQAGFLSSSEFYGQGSSLSFTVSAAADLTDGLQISDFGGSGTIFEFNGREVDTGRYHPALVQLNANGTGLIQNSNNSGGVNPSTDKVVDVNFGDEYRTALTFAAVPEPSSVSLLAAVFGIAVGRRRTR